MRFAVVGGDQRSALLCALLLRDGHKVHSFALERAALPAEIPKDSCLPSCVYAADCVILPVPAGKGGLLNAPLSGESLSLESLIGSLWPGQLLCGGKFSEEQCRLALREKLLVEDLMRQPAFVTGNAALTAEGAVSLLMAESRRCLRGGRALVLGFGRIGKLLCAMLSALGVGVWVAARGAADRAFAAALGYEPLEYEQLEGLIGDFDWIVNTVPAPVLREAALCCVSPEALLLELASPPGGFDRHLAENIGLRVLAAPGLPGTYAPRSAALLMRDGVYAAIREQEE